MTSPPPDGIAPVPLAPAATASANAIAKPAASPNGRAASAVAALWRMLATFLIHLRDHRELCTFNDYMLRDIGLSRADDPCATRSPRDRFL